MAQESTTERRDKIIVQASFECWQRGTDSSCELLTPE
jgi:hypothetical protein